jgi:hypothetical protein
MRQSEVCADLLKVFVQDGLVVLVHLNVGVQRQAWDCSRYLVKVSRYRAVSIWNTAVSELTDRAAANVFEVVE